MVKTTIWHIGFTFNHDLQGTTSIQARSIGGALKRFNIARFNNALPQDANIYVIQKEQS